MNELCHQVSEEEIYGADIATGTSASTGGKDIVLDTAGEATVLHQGHDAVEEYTKDASEKEVEEDKHQEMPSSSAKHRRKKKRRKRRRSTQQTQVR